MLLVCSASVCEHVLAAYTKTLSHMLCGHLQEQSSRVMLHDSCVLLTHDPLMAHLH